MAIGWTGVILIWLICLGIGAAITSSKNRGASEGAVLGGLLGIIGVVIAACLSKQLPKAPAGMIAVQCPWCNAAQNVPAGQPEYECWQCHTASRAPGFEEDFKRRPVEASTAGKSRTVAAPALKSLKNVRCPKCDTVQKVPDGPTAKCSSCQVTMKLRPKVA